MNNGCSVVIPTRDRKTEITTLLRSLEQQTLVPDEVIIVDAGTIPLDDAFLSTFPGLRIRHTVSKPALCKQRNLGIRMADGQFVFQCDDDVELPPHYLQTMIAFLNDFPEHGVVTGLFSDLQRDGGFSPFPASTDLGLLWSLIFHLGIQPAAGKSPIRRFLLGNRRNGLSKAGWPRITEMADPFFSAAVYSLGASVIRKEWLLEHPYDEILDEHGIGDHYGFAASLPVTNPITILTGIRAIHRKSISGRLDPEVAFFRRILALDYFQRLSPDYSKKKLPLMWSLVGLLLGALLHGNIRRTKTVAYILKLVYTDANPYFLASVSGTTGPVNPQPL